ncbi:MAG: glucose-6-phosphate dehydrogenase [Candidatus Babeliales bacterium]|nr:glucose-6-phosphate dehydrogenase [Candidatus Babeliales bacterium]
MKNVGPQIVKMGQNECAFIILGATGDLTKRKLLPAIYRMIARDVSKRFIIIGAAFDETSIDAILDSAKHFIEDDFDDAVWQKIKSNAYYHQLNFSQLDDFKSLNKLVTKLEKKHELAGNRVVYLATAASFFCQITQYLAQSGVVVKRELNQKPWNRIVYEKPFGHDLKSAQEINACIDTYLDENQAYRIDHYLTKELVSNIALIRFTNCVFEPLWNNRYIDNVQIVLSETVGVENRGSYYDAYGALRDVVQNHMLELMALIGMEAPEKLTGDFIRDARAKVLQKIRVVDVVAGQYDGYTQEKSVPQDSQTETFAALYLMIDNPRWAGVPFYLKTGKALDKKETVIHIKFKQVDCLLTKNCPTDSNYLTIRLAPEESFVLTLNAKKPGMSQDIVPISMDYRHSSVTTDSAYEVLLEEIIRGERSVSVRFDEIESAWKIIDSAREKIGDVQLYAQGSSGPNVAVEFAKKHGMRWRS